MAKSYQVVVEMESGERSALTVSGESSGAVFQQVKAMPGVRRVGKVSEAVAGMPIRREVPRAVVAATEAAGASRRASEREQKGDDRRALLGFAISGPRVVTPARTRTGEQPFKNLYVPPEKLKADVAPVREGAANPVEGTPSGPQGMGLEHRIVKSRRQDGEPYLLQRGNWQEVKGKRGFAVKWEKGFDEREKAERHLQWVQQTEREMVGVEAM